MRPCGFDPLPVKGEIYSLAAGATSFPSAKIISILSDAHGNFYTHPKESPYVNIITFRD